jgi:integrase
VSFGDSPNDTALNVLAQTRTFLGWLEKRAWTRNAAVTETIEISGKRRKGKPKLTQDEASKLLAWCLAHPHDEGAIATAMAFLLGMRASEIVTRTVRHLDGKGHATRRHGRQDRCGGEDPETPRSSPAATGPACQGKAPDDRLFGNLDRHWVFRSVRIWCKAAGVRVVSPHGLRGTHAKIAREVGMSGAALATAMGHESESTTTEHYAGRAAVANGSIGRVADLMQ